MFNSRNIQSDMNENPKRINDRLALKEPNETDAQAFERLQAVDLQHKFLQGDSIGQIPVKEEYYVTDYFTALQDTIQYAQAMRQFVVYNPTAATIKLGFSHTETDRYEVIVNAQKMLVSAISNFTRIIYLQSALPSTLVVPSITAYNKAFNMSPGIYSFT